MDNRDKAISTIPESPAQAFIKKADRRDKIMRGAQVFVLFVICLSVGYGALSLRDVVISNHTSDIRQSIQAKKDRDEQKNYIKCIALLQFDIPKDQQTNRADVEKALDQCAAQTGSKD